MDASPFHVGEQALQSRTGVRERLEAVGRSVIRDHMPDPHRELFAKLPTLLLAAQDDQGQPWATMLHGPAGFVGSPDARTLRVQARPAVDDPLTPWLVEGAAVGLLGLEPHTRRRNRANGVVVALHEDGFEVQVLQSFGNCPKYIQAREPRFVPGVPPGHLAWDGPALDAPARRMIEQADTFFIATAHPQAGADADVRHGVDVSHRGGLSGFVQLDGDRLTVPDFAGNQFFNTLGNVQLQPRAGLLFIDFVRGDLLYLAVTATLVWDGPKVDAWKGARRLLELQVTRARRVEAALPLHWGAAVPSPFLAGTGIAG